jgi:O-succinylbenzoic acid--CoA ligase
VKPLSIFAAAESHPDALAVIENGVHISYRELAVRSARVASTLAQRNLLSSREPLGVVVRPTLASLELVHALIAARVPILLIQPALPSAERLRLVERAGARALLCPDEEPLAQASSRELAIDRAEDLSLPLAIVPTSGSTGTPKLVVLSRGAFVASAEASARNLPLSQRDRWLLCLPPAHVGGFSIITRSLLAKSALLAFDPSPRGLVESLPELARAISENDVSVVSLVPTLLDALLTKLPDWIVPKALRAVLVGGAALSSAVLERSRARGVPVLTTYGLTEACSQVTTTKAGTWPNTRDGLVSSGAPLPGVELRLGDSARIGVRSKTLCSSYFDAPAPFDADGWFMTEDRGYIDERGELYVLGRISDLIVTGGENVDPLRVEAALAAAPGVLSAVVFGVPDPRYGEVVACGLVTSDAFEPQRVSAFLRERLARHELPRRFARLSKFAALPNGKINRAGVRSQSLALLEPFEHAHS